MATSLLSSVTSLAISRKKTTVNDNSFANRFSDGKREKC